MKFVFALLFSAAAWILNLIDDVARRLRASRGGAGGTKGGKRC